METIDLGEGIISIDYGAFVGCTSLKEIYIPDSILYMGYMADYGYNVFYDTPNLIIRCEASQKSVDWPYNWSEGSKEVIWGC